nr:hypothetical protein BaRGS_024855 [Batillaria attramentaria]
MKLVDKVGKVLGWLDASEPGSGNWMKYVRSTEQVLERNMMAVQVDEQVFYKSVRDIEPGEEMLLYARDALYPEMELEAMAMHKLEDENQTYPCGDCGEVFRSKVALRRHQTYACPNSQTSFLRKMTLDTSQDRVDSDGKSMDSETSGLEQDLGPEGEYKCDQCPKSFQWKSNLVRHQVTHDEDRRYPCENCDKIFTDPSNLQRHIRSQHVGARCHACTECGKTFATSSGLKQHQHIHSSVKPFQCEVCLKAYTQFSNLCRHKRMHADCRQQIKCKDCGQAFSTVTSLSKHKRFCEGALRSGMRLCYSQDKLSPMALSPGSQAPPHFNPAYMYGPRPPFPFFPPLGSAFPVLQSALPHGMLGGAPLSPSAVPLGASSLMDKVSPDSRTSPSMDKEFRNHKRQLYQDDDMSDGDLDMGSVSEEDEERELSPSKRQKLEPGEIRPRSSFSPRRRQESPMKLPLTKSMMPHSSASSPPQPDAPSTSGDMPFDLSKPVKKQEPKSPSPRPDHRTPSPKSTPTKDDLPLDLSKKAAPEVFPVETPRKTHIYGEMRSPVVPEPKYPFPTSVPYPFPSPASLVESMLRLDKEKHTQSHLLQQDLAKFMAFPRYPIPGLPPAFGGMNPLSMLRPDMDKGLTSPLLKMDKSPVGGAHTTNNPSHVFPYSSPSGGAGGNNKLKERYACKFCGKIFPRSANLTRHLRTHTGEQPYKCKYCERSFSISSNLQRHVRNIHNKEKPFRCPLCERSFGQQTNLDRHLKKHEQEGPNVADSPTPELDPKDEAYFSEIRSFLSKDPEAIEEPPSESDLLRTSPSKKDLSDLEDEKESDLTIVDDEIEEELDNLSDEAEGEESGGETTLTRDGDVTEEALTETETRLFEMNARADRLVQ